MILTRLANERQHSPYAGEPSDKHIAYAAVFWPIMAVYLTYVVSTFALYLYFALHMRDHALVQRSPYLSILQTVFGAMYCINAFLQSALKHYPCFVQIWLLYMGYTIWTVTVIIAMLRYYVLARSHSIMSAKLREIPVTPENLEDHLAALLAACGTDLGRQELEPRHNAGTFGPRSTSRSTQHSLLVIESDPESGKYTPPSSPPRTALRAPAVTSATQPLASKPTAEVVPFAVEDLPLSPPNAMLMINEQTQRHYAQPFAGGHSSNGPPEAEPSHDRSRSFRSSVQDTRTAIWRRRLSSNRFINYVILGAMLVIATFLLLVNIFSPQMSLRPIYYNCYKGWEYVALAIIAGICNIVVCPAFVIMAWTYKDGYGIRRSLSIGSASGLLLWVGALAWRLEKRVTKVRASPSLFYVLQVLLVYSFTVVSPLYVAWQNAGRQKTHDRATHGVSQRGWSWSAGVTETEYDLSKQSFMAAMQDADEHDSIERFAGRCFCTELVSFLDVYLALKMSIYKDIWQHGPRRPASTIPTDSDAPAHSAYNSSIRAPADSRSQIAYSLGIEGQARTRSAPSLGSQAALAASVSDDLASLSTSITTTMAHAFPEYAISDDTLISERLRSVLKTIVRTFLLPESPLAINVPHVIVCSFRDYLLGGPATFGLIEQVKEEVISLLYSNVYIRYRQA